jgi:hypothetical protein
MREYNKMKIEHPNIRMGQMFINEYIPRVTWPDLFYAGENKAIVLIQNWLKDHQYIDNLPMKDKE